ncbi:uncharacterized protein LY79DRAFT_694262 [Colletotrichum navitas]|uniref:Uncharacterized protein n=1 Tax=Colletotrichum navitas TaxID=681940 RepID=A0AAD8UZJ1_9PEZI|nr:uncharacterized protein LY79DRAFT_694262 [Colletotrichum navitas]KAK1579320.1 hypothetical protein LY79DRAFT_694262 [Colletotrichum navitas]
MHIGYSSIHEDDVPDEQNASRLEYCFATLSPTSGANADSSSGGDRNFAVTCRFQEIPDAERSCWFDLVSGGAVIAANFPVPARHDEKGLEIPMGILVRIAVIHDAIEYKGGIVMKGPTLMLVPIKRNADLSIIQWHVVSASKKRKRLTYLEGVEKCKQRALVDEVDLQSFLRCRAIVGWWDHAKSRLGDEDVNFDNLRWSTAKPYEPLRVQNIAAGLQQIGVLNIECAPGRKDSGYLVKFEGPYGEMLSTARGEKAFLYDTVQQRAWLVTWDEVILHIIRKRNSDRPFVCNGAPVKIPTMGSAMQSLLVNRKLVLVDDEDEPETLRLTAIRIFNQLETLAAMDDDRRQAPEKALNVPDVLIGHEFMSISLEDSPWGKDYLAATTDTLLRLYFKGNETSQEYLTSSGLCWHKHQSVKLFEKFPEPASSECGCSRLQQIVPKPVSIGAVDRPRTVAAGGAVIFGIESIMAKLTLPTVLWPKKDAVMYSQPNLQIECKMACENGSLDRVKEDRAGRLFSAPPTPISEAWKKKAWAKRGIDGETLTIPENGLGGKRQKH